MAAHGGGVEWTSIVKPILSGSFGTFTKAELLELVKAIIKSENEILEHDIAFEPFYLAFTVVAADYISANCTLLSKNQLTLASQACGVLITYILQQLRFGLPRGESALSVKQLLAPLTALCAGTTALSSSELVTLTTIMKNTKLPDHIKTNVTPSYEKETPKQDSSKRSRSDLAASIVEQFSTPLGSICHIEGSMGTSSISSTIPLSSCNVDSQDGDKNDATEAQNEIRNMFAQANVAALQSLGGGEVLLGLCLSIPAVSRYRLKYEEASTGNKPLALPSTHSEAVMLRNSLPALSSDIALVSIALALPVLEPLTPSKISQLSAVTISCLCCAVSTAIACSVVNMGVTAPKQASSTVPQASSGAGATAKEDESDSLAVGIVEKALDIYGKVGDVLKHSTKGGGHIYQNHLLLGAWVVVGGLQGALGASGGTPSREDKGKSPSKVRDQPRVNLIKVQQGFGVLSVALASQSLPLLGGLLQDLQIEAGLTGGSMENTPAPADLNILGNYSALQRVMRVLQCAPVLQLYTYIATVSYRKACALKRVSKHPLEGDALSQSDSTTYYNDIISCSDDSETEEEDSESYLGLWFKETLAPESDDVAVPEVSSEQASGGTTRLNTIVPDKDEPHEYLELSTSVFRFLDTYLSLGALGSSCSGGYLARYIQTGLTEQQMCLLAAILRDLDRDTARNESGLQSGYCALWQTSSILFAQSLSRYIHNMVASGALGDTLQAALLAHLGVSPWLQDCNLWPLQVYSHTLAVLAQVVLLKPQQEKEAACISVWTRLVNTLVESVCTPGTNMEDGEDINVEHAQLLIFLFHSLNLMQKKSLLLLTAGGVIRCSLECPSWASNGTDKPAKDSQVLLLSRFLLLLEYIMKHLYDAPQILLEQIQWNLFSVNNSKYTDKRPTRMFTQCKEIEDNYRKLTGLDDCTIKPRFYSLSNVEYTNQDSPKLDGLACNFILGTPDKLKYAELVDALIRILNVTNFCVEKCGYQTLCAVQYCFSLCWRLLIILPPSSDHINEQCSDTIPRGTATLHSLIWGPRAANTKTFSRWLTDCLVKQGMYTQNAESLLRSVSSTVNESKYDVDLAIKCIQQFVGKSKLEDNVHIKLTDILLLDSILGKIQMVVKDVSGIENKTPADFATQALMVEFIPYLVDLIKTLISACYNIVATDISETDHVKAALIPHLFALSSQRHPLTTDLSAGLWALLPAPIKGSLDKYKNMTVPEINPSAYNNDIIPSESYILAIINTHINSLSSQSSYSVIASLKNLLKTAVSLLCQHVKCIQTNPAKSNPIADLFVALALDVRAKFLYDSAKVVIEQLVGDENVKLHQLKVYYTVLSHSYKLIVEYSELTTSEDTVVLDEKVLHCIFKFWEKMLDKEMGQFAMYQFFSIKNEGSLVEVLLSIGSMFTSQVYSTKVLHFFNKLFQASEKSDKDFSLEELCNSIAELASVDSERLQGWLRQVLLGTPGLTRSPSSSSSNVPTPTNTAATASSIPSVEKESTPKPDSTSSDIAEASVEPRSASAPSGNEVTGADGVTGTGTVTGPDSLWAVQERSHSAASHSNADDKNTLQENGLLLQALTNYIVTGNKLTLSIAPTILQALIPLGSEILCPTQECLGFPQLMSIMATLADSNLGKGHTQLFTAVTEWLEICKQYLLQKDILEKLESGVSGKHTAVLESSSCLLNYLGDLLHGLGGPSGVRSLSPPWEGELPPELPDEWLDELQEEDDSGADDSDEDSLSNKLCTFTVTQKEFMNQHWYHCHTCKMLDGVGVCTVCARVCHRGHDISYAKYGNFFCDCGAKEDNTCQALSKRGVESTETTMGPAGATNSEHLLPSSLRCRASSPVIVRRSSDNDRQLILAKHIDSSREFLKPPPQWRNVTDLLLSMTDALLPALNSACARNSTVGCHKRAQAALAQLHLPNKKFTFSDKLMVPTLGSQEGAFENVRMSYSGEQGATIRQLLSAHMIRRVAMCCLSSSHGKRQHLAVSHEKGKITVLQLSALLKQADTSKKKLTLTRLSSAPIPFTVLSLTSNPCNEDFLAVCGLKECHVLTFSSIGAVSDHLVLHPQLETGNFIIRAIWLPGSQTILALVTADFVKIYDLGKDALSPQYYFLVPSGKVRDCTFVCQDGVFYMLLMASVGYIYTQPMVEESHAKHGPFYVTNTLELNHPDITDVKGQVGGGGVSIYYSHCLQMLFFSYTQGKSFMTPMYNVDSGVCCVVPITLTSGASKTTSKGAASTPQPLCQWSEVPGHPGLVCSTLQTSNNPVVLMLNPDTVVVQEIKVLPAKAKIMDMVAIRHAATGLDNKTTLILLCEDGSLRIYAASAKYTGYWLSPAIQPTSALTPKSIKKSSKKSGSKASVGNKSNGALQFPIDFFEHCISMNDVEFGGNDLLQIYNHTQLKHRLNSTGMYVASTKSTGFTLEITNSDTNLVICGIRVLLGNQDVLRTPGFVEVLGRNVQTTCVRTRWFDVPFTREQSLQADKKISVLFGPSQDPDGVIMIDSVKVYGKTKEVFGWPEEPEDAGSSSAAQATVNQTSNNAAAEPDTNATGSNVSGLDKTISGMLEVVEGSFSMCQAPQSDPLRSLAISTSTKLLTMPTPVCIQMNTKLVLSALYPNRTAYHAYKDQALLAHVIEQLAQMRSLQDPRDVDPEAFYRIVLIVRGIATSRPANLAKYTSNLATDDTKILMNQLMDAMWMLHAVSPSNLSVCPVVVPGLPHAEVTIHALVEIIHAYTLTDLDLIGPACQLYVQLLLCEDSTVSFSAKQALIRVLRPRVRRRRVFIPSPPTCSTPQATSSTAVAVAPPSSSAAAERFADVETVDPIGILGADGPMNPHHNLASLEALLAGAGQGVFPQPMLDIPPDADDETMMELAIALSMQDQEGDMQALQQGLQGLATLQNLGGQLQGLQVLSVNMAGAQGGNHSDTTASAGDSDDEGSNAATDGSTLRTSPAEQGGSIGSESGCSGADSIGGVSGRSSSYGDHPNPSPPRQEVTVLPQPSTSTEEEPKNETEIEAEGESASRLHQLRLSMLNKMVYELPQLKSVGGTRAIPFMQVLLILTSDLNGNNEKDSQILTHLLNTIVEELNFSQMSKSSSEEQTDSNVVGTSDDEPTDICTRTNSREVNLVLMRLLSVLMSRWKQQSKAAGPQDNSAFVARTTANVLCNSGVIEYCHSVLQYLLSYWSNPSALAEAGSPAGVTGALLKEHLSVTPPDMQPFFLKQYVKGHAADVFEDYPQLLTEMAVRLPYQIHKHTDTVQAMGAGWQHTLCEYMMNQQTPFVRKQVRKLLLFLCGHKDKYRQVRDIHSLQSHLKAIRQCCDGGVALPYDSLVELVEHLKACLEVASTRTGNWQRFCVMNDTVLPFLMQASCMLDEGVSPTILQLLQSAICATKSASPSTESSRSTNSVTPSISSNASSHRDRRDREKSEESDSSDSKFDESQCIILVNQINSQVSGDVLQKLIKTFLLETNNTNARWQAHALVLAIYTNSSTPQQEFLLDLLWKLWPLLPAYGRRTAQFVDLLGYFSLKTADIGDKMGSYMAQAVSVLQAQNNLLGQHSNAQLYSSLSQYVELEGYYLESEPCLVCNNPEIPLSNIKLSSIKIDSKFTTTTTIVKLVSSHTISKITLRIADLKRTKMVRVINIYYNNRSVQAVVELKNKPAMWHKAKKVTLQSNQTEVKIDFPLPITACNLMIEYADFYETMQGSSESLQCPRCSAAVPANPGVCGNCGENVFQCHKCRAINYDEKDPFLCHACGFCKYAKFDYTLLARPCCAVDSIENDDDRRKTVQNINSSLEKADRVYQQLIGNKPVLELLVKKISEHRSDLSLDEVVTGSVTSTTSQVNKVVQLLAQKYCVESKNYFEELSKILQRVEASRKELVAYDRKQMDFPVSNINIDIIKHTPVISQSLNRCFGCALAATEHCLTLLRAMASFAPCRLVLCGQGLLQELVNNNLRGGTGQIQEEVRQLLCLLTRDVPQATQTLCTLLVDRITLALKAQVAFSDFNPGVRHEMALLAALVTQEDSCWEQKLRTVMKLFMLACNEPRSPAVMEAIVLPCLRILQSVVSPPQPTSEINKDKTLNSLASVCPPEGITVNLAKWLNGDPTQTFSAWKQRMPKKTVPPIPENVSDTPVVVADVSVPPPAAATATAPPVNSEEVKEETAVLPVSTKKTRQLKMHDREYFLKEKYYSKWSNKIQRLHGLRSLNLDGVWLKSVLFSPRSRLARQVACTIVQSLSQTHERHREMLLLLTGFLPEISHVGKCSDEFLSLYKSLTEEAPWKQYLALKGVLTQLADLLTHEIQEIHRLEETTLTADIAQGYALKQLTELLSSFMDDLAIRQVFKGRLVGAVLGGFLSLKSLVVQRTRLIDDTQERLLEMLEEMTTGTEAETKAFMSVCIETVQKYSPLDVRTPVFIFERLCSIIYPEENDIGEFYLSLEKDPQQEDFLQGRMLGNPYSSTEAGLGPLMRDVKNKICQDCELVALLEDDNGMELLVNNKIMSLDLPVKEVYKKVWLGEGCEGESMRVVYRMRGLLGDATEEFVETLHAKAQQAVDNEELYRMANVLADCGGLQIMLDRLNAIQNVSRARPLLQVLLKLFRLCVKVRRCQEVLCRPELGAVAVFLKILQLCLQSESDAQQAAVTEQLLDIMETILSKAANESLASFLQFSSTFGGPEYIQALLSCTNSPSVRNNQAVLDHLTKVVAALVYGNDIKMAILCEHFRSTLDFNKFDTERTSEDEFKLELFCVLCCGIEKNCIGGTLKDYIISLGIVKSALEYITMHAPCVKPTLLRTDSDELKEFISKPALKYILRFLTGLAAEHEATQLAVSQDIIPIIHRLEQVSSDEHVGSLAENLLEALRTDPATAARVQQVREFTRAEKKRLAMAMREKQLGALGMRTNDKGQVTAKSTILQQMEELGEETGLVCVICREGYKCQPTKVLCIYTFSKRCNVEDYDSKARWTMGYTTVTHFNVVHVDCHISAVRLARVRDEWESAGLQNANTRCNGLLPLWGPQVPELAFVSCLARHDSYLQDSTGHRDIGYASTVHDLKLLLLRFAQEKSFHEDAGGGGPQSNMHLVPYLIHMALYVINTTRMTAREEKNISSFLENSSPEKWIESAHEADGPLYVTTMAMLLHPPSKWRQNRMMYLKRLIILAHTRRAHHIGPVKSLGTNKAPYNYPVYKAYLMFFAMIGLIYQHFFKSVSEDESWPVALATYIRRSDEQLLRSSEALLTAMNEELLPCTSFQEFCDVAELLEEISDCDSFIKDLLNGLP